MPSIREVEERFLSAIRRSNFLYLFNPEQYLGLSAAFEIGYAVATHTPIYSKEPLSLVNADYDIAMWEFMKQTVQVASPAEATQIAIVNTGM